MTTFDEIDRIFNRMSGFGSLLEGLGQPMGTPIYYGRVLTVGPDGRPHVQEYGNCQTCKPDHHEPLVDTIVDDKAGLLKLVAELPGVEKDEIDVGVQDGQIEISAQHGEKQYRTTVPVGDNIDRDSAKATYKNGVLEVSFKTLQPKPSGKRLEVN